MALEVTVDHLTFRYTAAGGNALEDVSFLIPPGSCCALLGPTGAGKTTLLGALSGSLGSHHKLAVCSGSTRIGTRLYTPMPDEILFPSVGLCMQEPYVQISGMRDTVYEEILFTLENIGKDGPEAEARIDATLSSLRISHLAERDPRKISGGELQRVALATVLVARPSVLLLDEPANSLDYAGKVTLAGVLRSLGQACTVLLCDHSIELALEAADIVGVMDSGRMVFFGTRKEFLESVQSLSPFLPVDEWTKSVALVEHSPQRIAKKLARVLALS